MRQQERLPVKRVERCDRCDQLNPIASECNFCPKCRADYSKEVTQRREEMKKDHDKFWNTYSNRY